MKNTQKHKNIVKLFKTLLGKGLMPSYIINNAGGYDNGIKDEKANVIDGYTLEIEYGCGIAYDYAEVRLYNTKNNKTLVIEERYVENCNNIIKVVPNRQGHKVLKMLGYAVFENIKKYWNSNDDDVDCYIPAWY